MEKRLLDVLDNKGDNYILPFYWQHGECEELLREGMEKIYASGIRAVCVESRPHPDYVGEKWWQDMDIILDEAKKLDMKVWILDDAHFPSGNANGQVKNNPLAKKRYLDHYCIDVVGPMRHSSFMINLKEDEELLGVTVGLRNRNNSSALSMVQEVTNLVQEDMLYWDVPEGLWCVTVIKTTSKGSGRPDYINVIDRDAVRFFVDTVYEPHYKRLGNEFGKTIVGFFSDEPEIGNAMGYVHSAYIGQGDMPLPWCRELESLLMEKWKEQYAIKITSLWHMVEDVSPLARLEFMDFVTDLYNKNFCTQIGDWCREHGVEYIGHVIEDGGCHSRLGYGTGHFFRALWGQDMSGIDVVLQQIRPGLDDTPFYRIGGKQFYYGEFFHHGLAKMGVSLGHMDEKKKGRTMCEVYGAYGWAEGLKLMKWLTDHMLVRGVNYFVPHAFTMKEFPDPDCPPHFYARNMNPQYPYFKYLMNYMNRVSHLINGGLHIPDVAVLYHAEAEWAGEAAPFEQVGSVLAKNQIDYEVIPVDVLSKSYVIDGKLLVGKEKCKALIIPRSQYLPQSMLDWCNEATAEGLPIISFDQMPEGIGELELLKELHEEQHKELNNDLLKDTLNHDYIHILSIEELVPYLRSIGAYEIKTMGSEKNLSGYEPDLRSYHYKQAEGDFYLFFNESPYKTIETRVRLFRQHDSENDVKDFMVYRYDAFDNNLVAADYGEGELNLNLSPYETYIAYVGDVKEDRITKRLPLKLNHMQELHSPWRLTMQMVDVDVELDTDCNGINDKPNCEDGKLDNLVNLSAADQYPHFSGTMVYETTFTLDENITEAEIDFGEVYETMELQINGQYVGVRIAPPYRLRVDGLLKQGENHMKVTVVNTLVHKQRDYFSLTMPVEPSGLLGPVVLLK